MQIKLLQGTVCMFVPSARIILSQAVHVHRLETMNQAPDDSLGFRLLFTGLQAVFNVSHNYG
jgi:hypothetical protein